MGSARKKWSFIRSLCCPFNAPCGSQKEMLTHTSWLSTLLSFTLLLLSSSTKVDVKRKLLLTITWGQLFISTHTSWRNKKKTCEGDLSTVVEITAQNGASKKSSRIHPAGHSCSMRFVHVVNFVRFFLSILGNFHVRSTLNRPLLFD